MSVRKRRNPSGKVVWFYRFAAPGSTRKNRREIREFGFKTKEAAVSAEAARRLEEQAKYEMARAGAPVSPADGVPETLGTLLQEFFRQYAQEHLAPKTLERYRELAGYLAPELRDMKLADVTPLHLNREWSRLLKSGGHKRRSGDKPIETRPLSAKTVRNIAGVVSSAYSRAIKWQLVKVNPVEHSEPPVPPKHKAIALTTAQQDVLIGAASGPWCIGAFLEVEAATGARRGEILALRWSDIVDGRAILGRSLTQTARIVETPKGQRKVHDVLDFKPTKTEEVRVVTLPASAIAALEAHRKRQAEFRAQFGADYRADLDLIFANPEGTPLRPDSVSATVSALFKRLKIQKPKGAALHLLRHSHGSHMLASGVPLTAVSERLGHSSVRVTADVYSHAVRGQDDEAVRKWEEYQKQNRPAAGEGSQKGQVQ